MVKKALIRPFSSIYNYSFFLNLFLNLVSSLPMNSYFCAAKKKHKKINYG